MEFHYVARKLEVVDKAEEKESSRITVFTAGVKSCPKIELVRTPVIFSLCSYYLYVLLVELL